jgi:hypothetical protein
MGRNAGMEMRGPVNEPGSVDEQIDSAVKFQETMREQGDSSPLGGGGVTGHFAVNPEQVEAYAKRVEHVVERARKLEHKLGDAHRNITPPAPDKHSQSQSGKAKDSVQAAITHLHGLRNYGQGFAKELRASAQAYRGADEQGARDLGKLAG